MGRLIEQIRDYFTGMDMRAKVSMSASVLLFLFVILMFFRGSDLLSAANGAESPDEALMMIMNFIAESPFAPLGVVVLFSVMALAGVPQFLLIGVTVAIFGAVKGAAYAWGATMVSAWLTFSLGYFFGGGLLRRYGGRLNEWSAFLGRHGILATALVRVVPTGPFIVVNMVAGASHISTAKFLTGTAFGTLPKTILIAILGDRLLSFMDTKDPLDLLIIAGVFGVWAAILVGVRAYYQNARRRDAY